MATSKSNAVPSTNPSEYCVFDSDVPSIDAGDNLLTRSLPKATGQLLKTAINDVKGVNLSKYRARVFFAPDGYNGNLYDTVRIEFTALYRLGVGKVASELVALARQREGEGTNGEVG